MKTLYLIFAILLISACGNQIIRPETQQFPGLEQAQNHYQSRSYRNAAIAYTKLYNQYHNDQFALFAADSWLQLNDFDQATQLFSSVEDINQPMYQLVRADLEINNGNYNSHIDNIKGNLRPRYLATKAKLESFQQNYLNAALLLIELSELDDFVDVNKEIINNLLQTPENQLNQALFNLEISDLQQGWLEAALSAQTNDTKSITQWQNRWHNHPANQMFNQTSTYENIAVLLPLTGRYKNISKSIQQGMMAALYRDKTYQQQLTFFDTGSNGESFSYAWYGAVESGAEFIIGPLEKNSIAQLTQINSSSVPVMLLNQIEDIDNPYGFFQFSLSKEDEVRNVANRLMLENKKRILLLAPETDSGRNLAKYFEDEFNYNGGQVVSHAFYPESTHDYSRELKQSLGLNDSQIRANKLKTLIAKKIKHAPQIRPDIDAIFIIAKPKNARLIKPQLKFFQAENVPVYATSQIQSSLINTDLDKDLNGIIFPQSAFIVDSHALDGELNFDSSNINSNRKFFALGYDAASMYSRIQWMQSMQNQTVQGMSGYLSVDSKGKVHRDLDWAQYRNGQPVLLPPIASTDESDKILID